MTSSHRSARRRSFSATVFRFRQLRQAMPHSSPMRCEKDSSQPSGSWVAAGLRSPRRNARHEQTHHGVVMTTSVSACASKRSSSTSLLSTIHRAPASKVRCVSINSSSGTRTQPGAQLCRSRWIKGRPDFAANWRENVLFPAPAMPVTTTRLSTALGLRSFTNTFHHLSMASDELAPRRRSTARHVENNHQPTSPRSSKCSVLATLRRPQPRPGSGTGGRSSPSGIADRPWAARFRAGSRTRDVPDWAVGRGASARDYVRASGEVRLRRVWSTCVVLPASTRRAWRRSRTRNGGRHGRNAPPR